MKSLVQILNLNFVKLLKNKQEKTILKENTLEASYILEFKLDFGKKMKLT